MSSSLAILAFVCLVTPAVLGDDGSFFWFPALAGALTSFTGQGNVGTTQDVTNLQARLSALETNVKSGAVGGCESGAIGPFNKQTKTATITFTGQFTEPPAVSLALSDLQTTTPNTDQNFAIRPTMITNKQATVSLIDPQNKVENLFVAYMVCPSNAATPMQGSMGYQPRYTPPQVGSVQALNNPYGSSMGTPFRSTVNTPYTGSVNTPYTGSVKSAYTPNTWQSTNTWPSTKQNLQQGAFSPFFSNLFGMAMLSNAFDD